MYLTPCILSAVLKITASNLLLPRSPEKRMSSRRSTSSPSVNVDSMTANQMKEWLKARQIEVPKYNSKAELKQFVQDHLGSFPFLRFLRFFRFFIRQTFFFLFLQMLKL
jgi:hypothetical protein